MKPIRSFLPLLCLIASCRGTDTGWTVYGGGKDNRHYSALTQIDTANVARLTVAWTYHTHDADATGTQVQVNGVEQNGVFYGVSPRLRVFALDAVTGSPKWVFDPGSSINVCRGITLYKDSLLFYSAGARLFCVYTATGKPVPAFGQGGSIDLHEGLDRDVHDLYVVSTTPGIIYKDLIIVSARVAEETPAAPGSIRAYDVHTGERRWIFHTIPWPGEPGYETWNDTTAYRHAGGANAWAGFSLDEARGIVYAPLGSASYDFYGGKRLGADLYANCVLALDAATGRRIWHFQTVHHDLWDRDLPTAPILADLRKDGKTVPAAIQVTKSGLVFLFDRVNGQPLYPVVEKPVPHDSELDGEAPWPTQPFPSFPGAFARQTLDLDTLVPDSSRQKIQNRLAGYHTGMFYPPSREGTVIFPGFDGGGEWGGPSFDPEEGVLYVNGSEMPWVLTMVDVPQTAGGGSGPKAAPPTNLQAGQQIYATNCMGCHGPGRQGGGNYPSLLTVPHRYNIDQFSALLTTGRRMMPAFKQLTPGERTALASFILDSPSLQKQSYTGVSAIDTYDRMRYTSTGYNKFLTPEGYPAINPPWGSLTAIDLNNGHVLWKDTLGDYPEFKARGIHTGTENYGGSVVTAGGVLFIAATKDSKFRAFNKRTGRLLWETDLPACGFATPTVYQAGGKEYVVIACGGGKLGTKSGDSYVAFALP